VRDEADLPVEIDWYDREGASPRELVNSHFDPHWNARGHAWAAEAIARHLLRGEGSKGG